VSRILVVSSYPPRHCGIGAYAHAQVDRLQAEGNRVTVLSPRDGDGNVRVGFFGGRPFFVAARRGRRYGRIVVHFQPALYYRPRSPLSRVFTSVALLWLVLRHSQTEIVVHEADRPRLWRPDYLLLAAAFRAAPVLLFHTDRERKALERRYRVRVRGRLISHSDAVRIHAPTDRASARRRLGIPLGEAALVAPGFIHPGKGFDRAVVAFRDADAGAGGRLYIVGSVKDPIPTNVAHARLLRELAAHVPGVELVERFVDDEEFDAWIAAADAVVLPYRESWSSGVLARAQAMGTPAVLMKVGGLTEQASPRDVVVSDDEELTKAIAQIASQREALP
jgi:glycosyltransferase involved in cell wall biosynthesis